MTAAWPRPAPPPRSPPGSRRWCWSRSAPSPSGWSSSSSPPGVLGGRSGTTTDLLVPIRPTPPELVDPANARALGTAEAPVTIDVWSDFQCPACAFFATSVEPDLIDEFVKPGTVRLVYRDYAFLDGGTSDGESHQAAAAARCAGEQGTFWQYHDYLFENQKGENKGAFRRERLDQIAETVGLDMNAFESCMGGDAPEQAVQAETDIGVAAGVRSTPTLAINGVLQAPGAARASRPSGR